MNIEQDIKRRFNGYHVEITLFPSGGIIECVGCEECGADDSVFEMFSWKTARGETLETSIESLEKRMTSRYGENWKVEANK